ncbi:MAG TPA: LLM class flavin-dependent oxidoreductase [Acidimicrobiales bacterium]|nr:LLM class flavin-dependent oxidoreductase [Acidimicrobiales bacterium]
MVTLALRFDLRAPSWGAAPVSLYRSCLEMAAWADDLGFDLIRVSEHHAAEDGYCPSPFVLASAIAARTTRARLRLNALILPLHDPVRVAEDLAVLDLVSAGRIEAVVGAGYRLTEFAMFGIDPAGRGAFMEEAVGVLRQAWAGEPFDYRGRRVTVLPRPVQQPHPPILMGGSSAAAARRAARLDVEFIPTDGRLHEVYRQERVRLGREAGPPLPPAGPAFVFVAEDPEQAWALLLPHLLHESNSYAAWSADGGTPVPYSPADDRSIREGGQYRVVTPEECVTLGQSVGDGTLLLHPLVAGLDPEVAWTSLELFATRVLPELRPAPPP